MRQADRFIEPRNSSRRTAGNERLQSVGGNGTYLAISNLCRGICRAVACLTVRLLFPQAIPSRSTGLAVPA